MDSGGWGDDDQEDEPRSSNKKQEPDVGENIAEDMDKLNREVKKLETWIDQLGTPKDNEALRGKLAKCRESVQKNAKAVVKKLHEAGSKINKDMHRKLTKEAQSLTKKVQETCSLSIQKERENSLNQQETEAERLEKEGADDDIVFEMEIVSSDINEELLRERNEGLMQVENDMNNLAEVMDDLGNMVTDQAAALDTIESHVDSTTDDVKSATVELSKARDYQKSFRRKAAIAAVGGVLAVGVGAFCIWFFFFKDK